LSANQSLIQHEASIDRFVTSCYLFIKTLITEKKKNILEQKKNENAQGQLEETGEQVERLIQNFRRKWHIGDLLVKTVDCTKYTTELLHLNSLVAIANSLFSGCMSQHLRPFFEILIRSEVIKMQKKLIINRLQLKFT